MNQKAYRAARVTPAFAIVTVALGLTIVSCTGDDSANHELTLPDIPAGEKLLVADWELMPQPGTCTKKPGNDAFPNNCYPIGAWYPYDDGSIDVYGDAGLPESGPPPALEVLELAPHEDLVTFDPVKPSKTALRIHGGPYPGPWGSGFSHAFVDQGTMSVVDYSGVAFWARRGVGGTSLLHIAMTTLDDTGKAQLPDGTVPICADPAPTGAKTGCSDPFGKDVVLHDDWRPYVIVFEDLQQQGNGYRPPGGFDKKNATGISFGNKQALPFDEYIDDIVLFK